MDIIIKFRENYKGYGKIATCIYVPCTCTCTWLYFHAHVAAYCPSPPMTPEYPQISTPLPTFSTTENVSVIFQWTASMVFPANHSSTNEAGSMFSQIWSQTHTVPFFLIIFLAPLINFKSPTFFTKFNALGKWESVLELQSLNCMNTCKTVDYCSEMEYTCTGNR